MLELIAAVGPVVGGALGALVAWFRGRKREKVEPARVVADAAAQIAGAVDDIVRPLRQEVALLRAHIMVLTAELQKHGIPVPSPPSLQKIPA